MKKMEDWVKKLDELIKNEPQLNGSSKCYTSSAMVNFILKRLGFNSKIYECELFFNNGRFLCCKKHFVVVADGFVYDFGVKQFGLNNYVESLEDINNGKINYIQKIILKEESNFKIEGSYFKNKGKIFARKVKNKMKN